MGEHLDSFRCQQVSTKYTIVETSKSAFGVESTASSCTQKVCGCALVCKNKPKYLHKLPLMWSSQVQGNMDTVYYSAKRAVAVWAFYSVILSCLFLFSLWLGSLVFSQDLLVVLFALVLVFIFAKFISWCQIAVLRYLKVFVKPASIN